MVDETTESRVGSVDLYWLPLGAGGRCARLNGKMYEAALAVREHRLACNLYHSALEVRLDAHRWVIEMAPVWNTLTPAAASSPKARSACPGWGASACSATRSGSGARAGSPTPSRRWTALAGSAPTPPGPDVCWIRHRGSPPTPGG
jgi:hypothetical protein